MKLKKTTAVATLAIVLFIFLSQGCATLQQIGQVFANLQRLKFKLENVSGFTLAGITIGDKRRLGDFSIQDAASLLLGFRSRSLPARFTLNVAAINPNTGSGGTGQTVSTLTRFSWRLLIDDQPTIEGDIEKPIEIPGTGQSTIIPLAMEIDLYRFFAAGGYQNLIDLALALGGAEGRATRLALDAQPEVSTPLGPITYPGRIVIVDKEFR